MGISPEMVAQKHQKKKKKAEKKIARHVQSYTENIYFQSRLTLNSFATLRTF